MGDVFWTALALVLVIEGLLPCIAPDTWRRVFTEMVKLRDGQIRFVGLLSLGLGCLLLWWVA